VASHLVGVTTKPVTSCSPWSRPSCLQRAWCGWVRN